MARNLILVIAASLVLASIAPVFRDVLWLMELPAHFRPHTAAVAIAICVIAIVRRMPLIALFSVAVVAVQVTLVLNVPLAPQSATSGVSIVSQNLNSRNGTTDKVVAALEREDADLIFLQEYTPEWHSALEEVRSRYDYSVTEPRAGGFGIAVFSRIGILTSAVMEFGQSNTPFIVIEIESPGFRGHLINVHFQTPMHRVHAEDRDRQLDELARVLDTLDTPYVVAGDFNNTPSSPSFREFMTATGTLLAPPTWLNSWPAPLRALGIPIDFAVGSGNVSFSARSLIAPIGSDHRGIRFRAASSGEGDTIGSTPTGEDR